MADEEVMRELKTIRTLLAIDKEEELQELTMELSGTQEHILDMLSYSEWRSISTSDVADELDVGTTTVRNHRCELEDKNLINKRGQKRGAEYRKTGLFRAAESLGIIS
jgi:predicted ArsR family transcriptional regulator